MIDDLITALENLQEAKAEYREARNDGNMLLSAVPSWKFELEKVNHCPQRQDSLCDQLRDLRIIANKFGFYDAADFLKGYCR